MVRIKSTQKMVHVWIYITLVIHYIVPPIIIFVSIIFYMFPVQLKVFFLFVVFPKKITFYGILAKKILCQGSGHEESTSSRYMCGWPISFDFFMLTLRKQAFGVNSSSHLHRCIGHPSSIFVQQTL
jgi:hypothetical protein